MKVDEVYFATTNEGKLNEARHILGVDVKGISLDIEEIQSLDPIKVTKHKAQGYFQELGKPVVVEDVSLSFEALNGLPGTYISDFLKALGNEGLTQIIKGYRNRNAIAQTTLAFIDSKRKVHIFTGLVKGEVSKEPKGKGFGWDPIFIPKGDDRTFGQMSLEEKNVFSMRKKAFTKFEKWLINNNK